MTSIVGDVDLSHVHSLVLQASAWAYLGEGAANVVVAYTGTNELLVGTVLRLRKGVEPKPGSCFPTAADTRVWGTVLDVSSEAREEWQWQYTSRIIVPLLGRRFVAPGELIPVTQGFLQGLSISIASLRPPHRSHLSIDPAARFALLLPNYSSPERILRCGVGRQLPLALSARGAAAAAAAAADAAAAQAGAPPPSVCPFLSVEIKPKCGFLPSSAAVCPGSAPKRSTSRFQLHQHLKRSTYCPLDLFSGDGGRVRAALRRLVEDPQNNLCVRTSDGWVYPPEPGQTAVADAAEQLPLDALSRRLSAFLSPTSSASSAPEDAITGFVELIATALKATKVLDAVLAAQRLDEHDVEGAIEVYSALFGSEDEVAEVLRGMASPHASASEARERLRRLPEEDALRALRNFLIALSAKDSSILLVFVPAEEGASSTERGRCEALWTAGEASISGIENFEGQQDKAARRDLAGASGNDGPDVGPVFLSVGDRSYLCRVAVVDTDIRPVARIPKYYLEEQRILLAAAAASAAAETATTT